MNELQIERKSDSLSTYYVMQTISLLYAIFALSICIMQTLKQNFGILFISALICVFLSVILFFLLKKRKTIFRIDSISVYMDQKNIPEILWKNIKEIGIGIGYIQIITNDDKSYNLDLSELKYSELKNTKSYLIELCESKNIGYHNI